MKALVTGAAGFVGSHVIDRLRSQGIWVLGLDLDQPFPEVPVDVVISLAASADPREALRDPVSAYENNVRIMVQTLEYARATSARVLHVSTNEVYGPGGTLPYRPRGPYAGGKACQEIICESYPDVPTTIVVTQSLFGERQQPDKLVPTVIRRLFSGRPVTLQRDDDGWAERPFLHASNLASALTHLVGHENGHRVHVGATEVLSVAHVARVLADALGRELLLDPVPAGDRPGHESTVTPIGNDVPGWQPIMTAEEGLVATARWYGEHPEWL